MKLLPIVPGCRAVLLRSYLPNILRAGKDYFVLGRSPDKEQIECQDCGIAGNSWELEPAYVCECQIMRIDGGDFRKEREGETERPKEHVGNK